MFFVSLLRTERILFIKLTLIASTVTVNHFNLIFYEMYLMLTYSGKEVKKKGALVLRQQLNQPHLAMLNGMQNAKTMIRLLQ